MIDPAPATTVEAAREPLPDAARVQILATEHWSLLATRSMTWNEIFTRASMFLTALSAAVVALALIAQASDFGTNFRIAALLILPLTLLLGIATHIRLGDAMSEDVWLVLGMNRLRHAYLDFAPDLAPYFTTSQYDDVAGLMTSRGPRGPLGPAGAHRPPTRPSRMLAATPVIVGIINAALCGVIAALVASVFSDWRLVTIPVGVAVALAAAAVMVVIVPRREIAAFMGSLESRFPTPGA